MCLQSLSSSHILLFCLGVASAPSTVRVVQSPPPVICIFVLIMLMSTRSQAYVHGEGVEPEGWHWPLAGGFPVFFSFYSFGRG
ncbi:hypothetical protein M378DRAFT_164541 [Amanita muscaria Koide BX008]|uniref:Secreted protein n=1 Tax=Amanita muscaria (strain Koide BX008) TaxID=946122 RepID=A0A0C2T9V5_AMAMK|nr:hypothetical protein M378DRAFT_164541 [Amanita muscaria Koide BX008]